MAGMGGTMRRFALEGYWPVGLTKNRLASSDGGGAGFSAGFRRPQLTET